MEKTRFNSAAFRAWKASSRAAEASRQARAARRDAGQVLRRVAGWERHIHWFLAAHAAPFDLVQDVLDAAIQANIADRKANRAWQRALHASKTASSPHDPDALRVVGNALSNTATGAERATQAAERAAKSRKALEAYEPVEDKIVRLP